MEYVNEKKTDNSKDGKRGSLLNDFLLPALQEQTFGDLLKWDPEEPSVFMVQWVHKAKSCWSKNDAAVFMAWDDLKGRHWEITNKNLVDSKQRLRAALRCNKNVKEIKTLNEYKRYKLLNFTEQWNGNQEKKHVVNQQSYESDNSNLKKSPCKKQQLKRNTCAKCSFKSGHRKDFKKHILSHKTVNNTLQCQECGLCFVSQLSLIKHLRSVHKIRNTLRYIREEGTNYVADLENATAVSKKSALECGICFTSFPNASLLRAHKNSHRMGDTLKHIKENKNYITQEGSLEDDQRKCNLECGICETIFPSEILLRIHKRSHGMAFINAIKSGIL